MRKQESFITNFLGILKHKQQTVPFGGRDWRMKKIGKKGGGKVSSLKARYQNSLSMRTWLELEAVCGSNTPPTRTYF